MGVCQKTGKIGKSNVVDVEDVRAYPIAIPAYTFDVHTRKGKKRGRTKGEFFREEYEALKPRVPGLFDDLVPE